MKLSPRTTNLLFIMGLGLVGMGLFCNVWTIVALSPWLAKTLGVTVTMSAVNTARIWLFDFASLIMGLTLIFNKYRTYRRFRLLSDFLYGAFFSMVLFVLIEGVFYIFNIYKGGDNEIVYQQLIPGAGLKGLIEPDANLGFKLIPNNQLRVTEKRNGKELYQATYTIDAYGRRVTPVQSSPTRKNYLLFFIDSFAFGFGVNDNQTLPFYVGQRAMQYRPYNYGVNAYGPQQLLARLEKDGLREQVKEAKGVLIYIFLNYHVDRVIGSMNVQKNFGEQMPYYTLDNNDRPVRAGNLISGRPATALMYSILGSSQLVEYFGLDFPRINDYHRKITARVIEEARNHYRAKFNNDDFYVLIYPGQATTLTPYFKEANIKYLDYSNLLDLSQKDLSIEGDGHPTAQAYRIVAEQLVVDLNLANRQ